MLGFLKALFGQWLMVLSFATKTKPHPILVDLPDELILMITDHLALEDKFLLSHTCRAMYRQLSCQWTQRFNRLSPSEKADFLLAIAYHRADRWFCANCCALHATNMRDGPLTRNARACVKQSRRGPLGLYFLEHHHVQLAVKLTRLRADRAYLARLVCPSSTTLESSTSVFTYFSKPKVVAGRFVLFEKMAIISTSGPLARSDVEEVAIMICPHSALSGSYPPHQRSVARYLCPSKELDKTTARALKLPGQEMHGGCEHCPTDFSVLFAASHKELHFCVWHDFGTYGPPSDPYWSSQVWTDQPQDDAPILRRTLGSSRDLYLSSR